jgi:cell division protein FtsX
MARFVVLLVGAVLTAVGVLGLVAGAGWLAVPEPPALLTEAEGLAGFAVVAAVVAAVALLALVLGLWLLWRQLTGAPRAVDRTVALSSAGPGQTHLSRSALEDLTATRLRRLPGVAAAKVRAASWGPRPDLRARLDLDSTADVAELSQQLPDVRRELARLLGVSEVRLVPLLRLGRNANRVR